MIHLHSHSEYSIADGLFSPAKWASAWRERGFKGAALTDHGTMGGVIPFYHEMRKQDITPILGMEAYFNWNPTEKNSENRKNMHLVLLAKNYDGLQNLFKLSKLSCTDGYYYRPRLGPEWLRLYGDNLVCLSACQGGPLSVAVYEDEDNGDAGLYPRLHDTHRFFRDIFGDDWYVEFQGHGGNQERVNKAFYTELVKGENAKYIITNDNHYIAPEHSKVQAVLKASAYGNSEAAKSFTEEYSGLWMKNEKEVRETFKENHEYLSEKFINGGIESTLEVFEKCKDLRLPEGQRYLPKFRSTINSEDLFKKLTTTKLKNFVSKLSEEERVRYVERFKKEYGVICKYKLQDYFLIVWDLIRFCDKHGIYVGLGRGSAAGCLISYILGIVRINPMAPEFDLIFERFLNPFRCESGELPDIDLDFESLNRQKIKDYIILTYGRDRVCDIGTYGRMKLKTSLIDFAKAMNVATHREILNITTKLDTDDFTEAYESSPELKRLCDKNIEFVEAVDVITGQIKSQSIHPAGIIIAPANLEILTPLKTQKIVGSTERVLLTQTEDKYIVAQGLLKFDILGVKQYDILKYVIEESHCPLTRENYVEEIDYNDENVWKLFREGETDGVFQFSSDGMKQLLIDIIPESIGDLLAANALYRPGCLRNGWHEDFYKRKNGLEKKWDTVHPIFHEITKNTYGVLVYQEQVMAIINKLGGVPMAESDVIRSALGKKDEEKLAFYGPKFIENAAKEIGKDKAESLWKQIMFSSEYNFNKSHSAAYAVLAYVSQHLKCYYPAHFWAAACDWSARKNKTEELNTFLSVAKESVVVTTPSINRSKHYCYGIDEKDEETGIRRRELVMSFTTLKGVGEKSALEIENHAPFTDFEDFYKRVNKSKVKINNIVSLIMTGAFDGEGDRAELYQSLYDLRTPKQREKMTAPDDLNYALEYYNSMGFFENKIKEMPDFDFSPSIFTEKDLVGCYGGDAVIVGGMVTEITPRTTKKGDKMGFVTIVDNDEIIKLTVFPDYWGSLRSNFKIGNIIEACGTKSDFGGAKNSVEVNEVRDLGLL